MTQGPLVVMGDTLLDIDLEGDCERVCPDAPVPLIDVRCEWHRPGGAGLAAMLASRSVSDVILVTALGADDAGSRIADLLAGAVEIVSVPLEGETPRKTRVRAGGQPVTRLDRGSGRAARGAVNGRVLGALRQASAILVADYGRGLAANPELRRFLRFAARRVPVVWDPHPRGPMPVPGTALATPNRTEAEKFLGRQGDPGGLATTLRDEWGSKAVAVTLGAAGAAFAATGEPETFEVPAPGRVPSSANPDTCGAGDRFAGAAAAALLQGADPREAVRGAVDSAARFVVAGAARTVSAPAKPTPADPAGAAEPFEVAARTRRRGGRLVATGGCFDLLHPGHIRLLWYARSLGDSLVVCLNSDESVHRLKGPGRPILTARDRARLLTALEPVDAVAIFDDSSPARLLDRLKPDIWVKGGDYAGVELPEAAVVRRYGGEIVFCPLVDGYSTTRLVTAARQAG